ncbi:MAG: hypothetical protein J6P21_00245 [Clostridia bacterium]|nr:hypothetical protein [Clostridia bacterium]
MNRKKDKNKKRKLTALAAAMFCFSANTKPVKTQAHEITIIDGDRVITVNGDIADFNPNNNKPKPETKKEDGIGSIIWPAALAVIGGVAGHYIGEAGSTRSMSNYEGLIGGLIGGIAGGIWGNKYKIKKAYDYFCNLFKKKANAETDSNTKGKTVYKENKESKENKEIKEIKEIKENSEDTAGMNEILNDFVQPLVTLRLFRFSELTDDDNKKIIDIMLKYSHHYEFINSTVTDFIIDTRSAGVAKPREVICEELKNQLLSKIKISITSYELEGLKNNLKEATKELNSIIKNLGVYHGNPELNQ